MYANEKPLKGCGKAFHCAHEERLFCMTYCNISGACCLAALATPSTIPFTERAIGRIQPSRFPVTM
ncbi:hypothetical protein BDZ91DRAFT_295330 [Kalaharituber pfeilii]|nr:hypothetical protein BDZ91DRAFT_295330 [Kalaharituber pfeilii]